MRIIITGSSLGIGEALALKLSNSSNYLFLFGRDLERLEKVKKECEKKGSVVEIFSVDVKNKDEMENIIKKIGKDKIDLVIANAGICLEEKDFNDIENIISTNLYGMLNTVLPSVEIMKKNKGGTVIAISSIVSYSGIEKIATYCASKAAIRIYLESMNKEWLNYGIKTKIILNGFVKTSMNREHINYNNMMSSEEAAEIIIKSINNNKLHIYFPLKYKIQFFFKMITEYFR